MCKHREMDQILIIWGYGEWKGFFLQKKKGVILKYDSLYKYDFLYKLFSLRTIQYKYLSTQRSVIPFNSCTVFHGKLNNLIFPCCQTLTLPATFFSITNNDAINTLILIQFCTPVQIFPQVGTAQKFAQQKKQTLKMFIIGMPNCPFAAISTSQ